MAKEWRCFHCDEVFTSERWAREHFGAEMGDTPACKIAGTDGHLVAEIRKLQDQLTSYRNEDNNVLRAWHSLQSEKTQAVLKAEELGYERGVRDMKAQGYCTEPAKHQMVPA